MPREHFGSGFKYVPRQDILSFEEVTRLVTILHSCGLRKVRITGGEPLLRHDLERLVAMLRRLPNLDLAMTTNGVLLTRYAAALRAAGLGRITISLDALDEATFRAMTDSAFTPSDVLSGLSAATAAGFDSIKINCVVKRGLNHHQILPLVDRFRHSGHQLRFIEYMDTGETNGWTPRDVVTADEILGLIEAKFPLEPLPRKNPSQTSREYRLRDGSGVIGIVASVSQPFCRACTRARLTAKGEIFTCLFAQRGFDLRGLMRAGRSDTELQEAMWRLWTAREDRYSELRDPTQPAAFGHLRQPLVLLRKKASPRHRPEMSYLGG